MAGFQTHITVSTAAGVGIAGAGFAFGVPPETCVLTGTLCSVAGMLPDIDSDNGVPLRETMSFGAAILPMMLIDRFQALHWSNEAIALAAIGIYAAIRFGLAEIIRRYTVHRGMWHSIPAAGICGALTFLIVSGQTIEMRLFKTSGVVIGFLSHLILDEIWSVNVGVGGVKVKKSFGTALKFFGKKPWANMSTYGKLALLAFLLPNDPMVMERFGYGRQDMPKLAQDVYDSLDRKPGSLIDRAIERTAPSADRVRSMLAQPQSEQSPSLQPQTAPSTVQPSVASPFAPAPSTFAQPEATRSLFAPPAPQSTIPTSGLRESPSSAALPLPGAPLYPR